MDEVEFTDKGWEFWSREPYPAACPTYVGNPAFGTPHEPVSSLWCASIMGPLKDCLSDGFVILDWGCGDGRLFNFLSKRFKEFRYYGLERPGAFGGQCVQKARTMFGHDGRAVFDLYGNAVETEAMEKAQMAVMGSVATHIPFPQFEEIVKRMLPILNREGVVVASMFIEASYEFRNGLLYGHSDCYGWVSYTQEQLDGLCGRMGLKAVQKETCFTENCLHRLIHFSR